MYTNDITVDITSDMRLFADDATVVKFDTDRERISSKKINLQFLQKESGRAKKTNSLRIWKYILNINSL